MMRLELTCNNILARRLETQVMIDASLDPQYYQPYHQIARIQSFCPAMNRNPPRRKELVRCTFT